MKNARVLIVFVCVMAAVNFASADSIRGINMDFVTIGHPGNSADITGYGAVSYNYRIGKYEVINAQWNTFTAAAGAPTGTDGGYNTDAYFTGTNQPTNEVSWYEAAQFCNWLTSGDKSKGAYQFSGNNTNPGSFLGINRIAAQTTYGTIYVIPTEDEWYKAAYFKSDGSGYSLYANGTNTAPSTSQTRYSIYSSPWNVGTGTMEQNGTFDMMGNVWEWNETISGSYRVLRGGSFDDSGPLGGGNSAITSAYWVSGGPSGASLGIGFRIAEIPELAKLQSIEITGPNSVPEESDTQYKVIGHYDNGSSKNITIDVNLAVAPDEFAQIEPNGLLTTDRLYRMQETCTIHSDYKGFSASKQVTIYPVCDDNQCTEQQLLKRDITDVIKIKQDVMDDLKYAMKIERVSSQLLTQIDGDKKYKDFNHGQLTKARIQILAALMWEQWANGKIDTSVDSLEDALKILRENPVEKPKPHK